VTMLWRQKNFGFARRLPVRWSAPSWRPEIIAVPPLFRVGKVDRIRRFHHAQQRVCIFRQSSETLTNRTTRRARSLKPTLLNLPRLRINNPSTI